MSDAIIKNSDLTKAKNGKKDEFYTQLVDIEKEMRYYKHLFKDKVVYCNCDDPEVSNFFKYFSLNFNHLGLKKLITSCYRNSDETIRTDGVSDSAVWLEYTGEQDGGLIPTVNSIGVHAFDGDGDFRSAESIALLEEADIVVTNPPFSLFREYIAQLMEYDKKFLVLGNLNAVTYKETFPLVKDNKIWFGPSIKSGDREFGVPDGYPLNSAGFRIDEQGNKFIRVKGVRWFTNLEFKERYEDLILYKTYNSEEYPQYDNYDAINIDKTKEIPLDYTGVMGVPITFLDKFNPEQFEIISSNDVRLHDKVPFKAHGLVKDKDGTINGKPKYVRILIKHKKVVK